jgi:oligopeptide/dipeptide ABC transporter ATP-binding protein
MEKLLTIENLKTYFFLDEGTVRAVDGVDLVIPRGTTLAIVGESGCGKSITAFSILRLISPPGRIVSGKITLHRKGGSACAPPSGKEVITASETSVVATEDIDLTALPEDSDAIRRVRGHEIAMIFQEPMTSLSPVHTVGAQIMEAVTLHTTLRGEAAKQRAIEMMERVGIPDALRRFREYPHELSGGLRQRAMIAMALSCRPSLLIADEPTTALDVTIQAQILQVIRDLQEELGMSVLLITHDLGVVAEMASEVAVMYMGRIVEQASVENIFAHPQHPYTQALLQSIPGRAERKSALKAIKGSVPDAFATIIGCPFHPRCEEYVRGLCDVGDRPPLVTLTPGHCAACLVRQKEFAHA